MKKYDIFGIGAALVDTEIVVTDDFLAEHGVGKGLMTLVDEERQDYLIKALREQTTTLKKLVVALRAIASWPQAALVQILFMPAKWRQMKSVVFLLKI